jgi:hypothetical protein
LRDVHRVVVLVSCLATVAGAASTVAPASPNPLLTIEPIETGGKPVMAMGPGGITLRFIERGRFALGFLLRNASGQPLTIVDVRTPEPGDGLVQQFGTRFVRWNPPSCPRGASCPGYGFRLSLSAGAQPQPFELAEGGAVGVELDYVLKACRAVPSASAATARQFVVSYRSGSGSSGRVVVPFTSYARLLLRMPKASDCSSRPRSQISLPGSPYATSSDWTVPGSAGDTCTTTRGGLLFRSRLFQSARESGTTVRVLIRLPRFRGLGLYRTLRIPARALGPAHVSATVNGGPGGSVTLEADTNVVTVAQQTAASLSGRFHANLTVPGGRPFRVYGVWRCTAEPS